MKLEEREIKEHRFVGQESSQNCLQHPTVANNGDCMDSYPALFLLSRETQVLVVVKESVELLDQE